MGARVVVVEYPKAIYSKLVLFMLLEGLKGLRRVYEFLGFFKTSV